MVLQYRTLVSYLEQVTDRSFQKLHVIGGGSQSKLLCQMIADALDITVIAGPKEATAIGNILAQLEAAYGEAGMPDLRKAIAASNAYKVYEPGNSELWKKRNRK